jgi:hypothetical protein
MLHFQEYGDELGGPEEAGFGVQVTEGLEGDGGTAGFLVDTAGGHSNGAGGFAFVEDDDVGVFVFEELGFQEAEEGRFTGAGGSEYGNRSQLLGWI